MSGARCEYRSVIVIRCARALRDVGVEGSNPFTPTIFFIVRSTRMSVERGICEAAQFLHRLLLMEQTLLAFETKIGFRVPE